MISTRLKSLALAALLSFAALPAPAGAATKLVIGQASRSATSWPNFVADALGLFKQEGLEVQTEYIGNVALIAQQTVGGSLDIGNTTFEMVVQAVESGAPILLVGATAIKYPYSMMSAKDVKVPADMKGKKAILPVPKNDLANFFTDWMKANGLKPGDVDLIYDGSSTNRYAALATGAVQAAAVNSPLDFTAAAAGYNKLIDFGSYVKGYGFVGTIARKDWLAKNRPTMEAYLRALAKATDWLYDPANHDKAVEILVKETRQDKEVSEKTYKYYIEELQPFSRGLTIPDPDFNNVLQAFKDMNVVKNKAATKAQYVDLSYLGK
jgi:NitT/TauT family transport system substrate-binding protein